MALKVAIIGAGPSGIAAVSALRAESSAFKIIVFERRTSIGGIWHYDKNACDNELPACKQSPMCIMALYEVN